jgi:3-hydroxyacyl-CoA dehydrogenase
VRTSRAARMFESSRLLRDMIAAGRLGRKTGGGFHDY